MKQNPKIKRNAMHAYITYMIYADLSHKSHQVSLGKSESISESVTESATEYRLAFSSCYERYQD